MNPATRAIWFGNYIFDSLGLQGSGRRAGLCCVAIALVLVLAAWGSVDLSENLKKREFASHGIMHFDQHANKVVVQRIAGFFEYISVRRIEYKKNGQQPALGALGVIKRQVFPESCAAIAGRHANSWVGQVRAIRTAFVNLMNFLAPISRFDRDVGFVGKVHSSSAASIFPSGAYRPSNDIPGIFGYLGALRIHRKHYGIDIHNLGHELRFGVLSRSDHFLQLLFHGGLLPAHAAPLQASEDRVHDGNNQSDGGRYSNKIIYLGLISVLSTCVAISGLLMVSRYRYRPFRACIGGFICICGWLSAVFAGIAALS